MQELNIKKTCEILNQIMEFELAGVVRYTHYGLMVTSIYLLVAGAAQQVLYGKDG